MTTPRPVTPATPARMFPVPLARPPRVTTRRRIDSPGAGRLAPAPPWVVVFLRSLHDRRRLRALAARAERITMRHRLQFLRARFTAR